MGPSLECWFYLNSLSATSLGILKMFDVFIMYVASGGIIVENEARESRKFLPDMHYMS